MSDSKRPRITYPTAEERESRLLTIAEAAEALNVSVVTLRRWAKSGKVKEYRLPNNHRRFREDDVKNLLKG
jgi:excisionase family DNA binding protein